MWHSNHRLSLEDMEFLNEFLKAGMSTESALQLVREENNATIIDSLLMKLKEGKTLESLIEGLLPKGLKQYLIPFMKSLPFSRALSLSLTFYKEEKENASFLLKNLSYPLILLVVSITALYLFDLYGLDSIMTMMKSFTEDLHNYEVIRIVIRILVSVFWGLLIVGLFLGITVTRKRNVLFFYGLYCRFIKEGLVKSLCSNELVRFVVIASHHGYKTKQSLELIRSLIHRPVLSLLAYTLDENLLSGRSLESASESLLFDPLLSRYLKVSSCSKDYTALLENYASINKKKLQMSMKKLSVSIQTSVYVLIGIIIVFIYQILFMPMQAISNF